VIDLQDHPGGAGLVAALPAAVAVAVGVAVALPDLSSISAVLQALQRVAHGALPSMHTTHNYLFIYY
jgi:hypothetical protein